MSFRVPEKHRLDPDGCLAVGAPADYGTVEGFGNYGMFLIPAVVPGRPLKVVAAEGEGWEHASVSIALTRAQANKKKLPVPTWAEMSAVKAIFWAPEDVVMQLHPRESEYVNLHEACLHLWRPAIEGVVIPEPPADLVGPVTGSGA